MNSFLPGSKSQSRSSVHNKHRPFKLFCRVSSDGNPSFIHFALYSIKSELREKLNNTSSFVWKRCERHNKLWRVNNPPVAPEFSRCLMLK